ncbi:PREDICTED: complement C5-like, partial [Galeopterus variegatus]|uniref:Complement C5-like n=1 Tax=Galeopterus variegatus TaxID=482537 RepID=A0ABM0QF61_GALVR
YKPSAGESSSGSSHAVMDISLPTGISANEEDLRDLVERVDQLLTDYQIKDGHVILQLNSIPSSDFLCVRFRIFELFQVGFLSPATFTVYEYHRPDKQCTMFYSTSPTELDKVCEGTVCKCVEADCGQMQEELDLTISADTRKETACKPEIAYAYKVSITSITKENVFVKYTATLLDIYKTALPAGARDTPGLVHPRTVTGAALLPELRSKLQMGRWRGDGPLPSGGTRTGLGGTEKQPSIRERSDRGLAGRDGIAKRGAQAHPGGGPRRLPGEAGSGPGSPQGQAGRRGDRGTQRGEARRRGGWVEPRTRGPWRFRVEKRVKETIMEQPEGNLLPRRVKGVREAKGRKGYEPGESGGPDLYSDVGSQALFASSPW